MKGKIQLQWNRSVTISLTNCYKMVSNALAVEHTSMISFHHLLMKYRILCKSVKKFETCKQLPADGDKQGKALFVPIFFSPKSRAAWATS